MWVVLVVGVEGVLAASTDLVCASGVHCMWGVATQSAVAVLVGVSVEELGGPDPGVVDIGESFGAVEVVFDCLEQ